MATNAVGEGSRNVSVNMPNDMADEIKKRCADQGISMSAYIKGVLEADLKAEYRYKKVIVRVTADDRQI